MNPSIKTDITSVATDHSWELRASGRDGFEKDGYEIYFHDNDGYELTIRDPETMERRAVYEHRGSDVHSPYYLSTLLYILENVESFVVKCEERKT